MSRIVEASTAPKYNRAQKKAQATALEAFLTAEAAAKEASSIKCAARDAAIATAEHGDVIVAVIEGVTYSRMVVDEVTTTNQHAKVIAALLREYDIPQEVVDALYVETAGSKRDRDLKKI